MISSTPSLNDAFAVSLRLLPSQGMLTVGKDQWDIVDRIRHMIMPAFVLALAGIANYSRILRTETLDVLRMTLFC